MDYFRKNSRHAHKKDPNRTYVVDDVEILRTHKVYSKTRYVRYEYIGKLYEGTELLHEEYFMSHEDLISSFNMLSVNKPEGDSV